MTSNFTNFAESSDEEEINLSPRKRRRNRNIPLDLDEINVALDFNGFLDVQTFFSDNFNWFEAAEKTILKLYPNLKEEKKSEVDEPCLNAIKDSKVEYNLDLSTLELSQVIKHRRLAEEDSEKQPGILQTFDFYTFLFVSFLLFTQFHCLIQGRRFWGARGAHVLTPCFLRERARNLLEFCLLSWPISVVHPLILEPKL